MNEPKLGQLIEGVVPRDAIHIAVMPLLCGDAELAPGTHIGVDGDYARSWSSKIGVVDPFLKAPVKFGERFWLFLYPGTITSLRHEWTHPAIKSAVVATNESEAWITGFAAELDQTYSRLMDAAEQWVATDNGEWGGEYTMDNSERYKDIDSAKWAIFWQHYEILTGKRPKDVDVCPFTCSC